jgi:hypothetical protein
MEKLTEVTNITYHANVRMQQRCIGASIVDYLLSFGEERLTNEGASIVYFDKGTKKKLFAQLDKNERIRLEHQINAYLILGDDGKVVTVVHRTRRLMKH